MDEVYVSLLNIVYQEVVPHFYVLGFGVKHRVFGNTNGTHAITHERYIGTLLTKSLSVYVIQCKCEQQLEAATYSTFVID
jgi:hypothetical protein